MADKLLINNVAYNWSMIKLVFGGGSMLDDEVIQGVSAISWNKKREVKNNYGAGGRLVSRGLGNCVCEAKITLDYATQQKLRGGLGSLMELGQFDLMVSFAGIVDSDGAELTTNGLESGWATETVWLKGCFFNEDGLDSKTDDDNIEKEFDLNPFDIEITPADSGGA